MFLKPDESVAAIGMRLKRLRLLAGLNRAQLAELSKAGITSISIWENAAGNVMTHKSADKIISAIKERGVSCTKEWLLKGTGIEPLVTLSIQDTPATYSTLNQLKIENIEQLSQQNLTALDEEIKLFIHSNSLAIITKIEHNSMKPLIQKGDIVGGIWQPGTQIHADTDEICLVELENKLDIRTLRNGSKTGLFHIAYISYNPHMTAPFNMQDITLTRIAPLKRLWRL